jgi:glutamyl-tRNA synthetase
MQDLNIMKNIVTRFAPSPTGYLHIGSARTALFSYLFAKHHGGKFLLRIEDTDRQRSTQAAVDAILDGLDWLGLNWDEQEIYQFSRSKRHKKVALELLEKGKAYKCFLTPEELTILREESMRSGNPIQSKWRNIDSKNHPDSPYVIRIKAPKDGVTIIDDIVQGKVVTKNHTLDDTILLRSDGTPTYMHAVVVDDHDMGITHIIRGDDHLTNAARQVIIYQAMDWDIPTFVHIPLIHGADGAKLSKRHGALGVDAYRDMGYLPEALCNYLLRLGWSHGNDEIINKQQAIEWFNLESIGKSPSRLDFKKLENVNNHYLKQADNNHILNLLNLNVNEISQQNILKGLDSLKQRAKTLIDLKEMIYIYIVEKDIIIPGDLKEQLISKQDLVKEFQAEVLNTSNYEKDSLMEAAKIFAEKKEMKLGALGGVFRIILTGSTTSPSVFEIMSILGKEMTLKRIDHAYNS